MPTSSYNLLILCTFFPIHIQFLGRDALTSGTLLILLFFLKYLFDAFRQRRFIKDRYDYFIYTLILFGLLSIAFPIANGNLNNEQVGQALRQYVSLFSGLLFFLILKNIQPRHPFKNYEAAEKLLGLFLLLIASHIIISLVVKIIPSLSFLFNIFLTRGLEDFTPVERDEMQRISSFVFSPEQYGETLAALGPLALYKVYKEKNPIWTCCFFLFVLGLILSVTRSGIVLFIAGISLSMVYNFKNRMGKTFLLANLALTIFFLGVFFKDNFLEDVFIRFAAAADTYHYTGSIVETINRGKVFYQAWDLLMANLTFFGNGITEFHFHNLYLTTLYQKGVLGLAVFLIVLFFPIISLIGAMKNAGHDQKNLIFACLLSFVLFLVNETKFEFTRHTSYQQIWWGIIALFYLVSKRQAPAVSASRTQRRPHRHMHSALVHNRETLSGRKTHART